MRTMGGFFFWDLPLKKRFNKPQTSATDHISRLKSRGMSFGNEHIAAKELEQIGYYRLCSYWLPYEQDHSTHQFYPNTCFEDVVNHYNFDRALRVLVMDAIERLEISIRTRWVYELIDQNDPHAHLNPSLFKSTSGKHTWSQRTAVTKLVQNFNQSREDWATHFRNNYQETLPPLWATCELMTLGAFSKWFNNTKSTIVRNKTARYFGLDGKILASFLHHIVVVRNIVAHHSRLWNRSFPIIFKLPKQPTLLAGSLNSNNVRYIYNTLTVLAYLMEALDPNSRWKMRLLNLLKSHKIDTQHMGFPSDYLSTPVWKIRFIDKLRNYFALLFSL